MVPFDLGVCKIGRLNPKLKQDIFLLASNVHVMTEVQFAMKTGRLIVPILTIRNKYDYN